MRYKEFAIYTEDEDLIFVADRSGRKTPKRFHRKLAIVLKHLGIYYQTDSSGGQTTLSSYSLRHWFITSSIEEGVDLTALSLQVGATIGTIYQHYCSTNALTMRQHLLLKNPTILAEIKKEQELYGDPEVKQKPVVLTEDDISIDGYGMRDVANLYPD